MNIEQEIRDLAIDIQIAECYGCNYDRPSQRDHTCMDEYYYQLAYSQAFDQIKAKYADRPEHNQVFDRFGYPGYGSSYDW